MQGYPNAIKSKPWLCFSRENVDEVIEKMDVILFGHLNPCQELSVAKYLFPN